MLRYNKCDIKLILDVFYAFIFAYIIETLLCLNFTSIYNALVNDNPEKVYTLNNIIPYNIKIEGDLLISTTDDPMFYINDIDAFVEDLDIWYDSLSHSSLPLQVFYSDENGQISETNSVWTSATINKGHKIVSLKRKIKSIRIDLSTSAGSSWKFDKIILNPSCTTQLIASQRDISYKRIIIYALIFIFFSLMLQNFTESLSDLFTYRWGVGIALIIICTLLKLHGSSIGMLANFLGTQDSAVLWGGVRSIFSDEYIVFTGRLLGQAASGFHYFSDIAGYSPNDMNIIYGQPIWDITTIFRPFFLLCLFIPIEYAFAFFWSSRIIICFLVSFEFGRIITRDNRGLALAYALLVVFSPLITWWGMINATHEMLIFGQLALVILFYYLRTNNYLTKFIYMLIMVLCSGAYIAILYPPRVIPFAYTFLMCAIAILIENRKLIKLNKYDIVLGGLGLTFLLFCIHHVLTASADTIEVVTNTIYPGRRRYYGGPSIYGIFLDLFRGWSNYVLSFIPVTNPCEKASFINFYPLGFIFSIIYLIRSKKFDAWLVLLNIINIFFTIYFLFKLPNFIGDLTLLNRTTSRLSECISFINLLLLFRSLILLKNANLSFKTFTAIAVISSILSLYQLDEVQNSAIKAVVLLIAIIATFIIINLIKSGKQQNFIVLAAALSFVGGFLVNPISSGLADAFNLELMQQIKKINDADEGNWITDSFVFANIPTFVGAKSLNASQTYPDKKFWKDLGLEERSDVWNRYNQISLTVVPNNTSCVLLSFNHVMLYATTESLRKIKVKYIISAQDLHDFADIQKLTCVNNRCIYKLN